MALDILTTDLKGNIDKSIQLYLDDYDYIMEKVNASSDIYLFKESIVDYYGDSEIFLNDLEILKNEILALESAVKPAANKSVSNFITDFLMLIDYAILNRQTIKFVAD